jgi:hypothetical protein
MTQYTPGQSFPPSDSYVSPPSGRNGLATASLICGIVGLLLAVVGIGLLLAIVAIVLGAVGLSQIGRTAARGKGMAISGIILGILTLALMPLLLVIAILLPSLSRARELSNRAACAANLRGLSQAMVVYAAENNDSFPVVPYAPFSPANAGTSAENTGESSMESGLKFMASGASGQNGSPLAGPWLLVIGGQANPRNFVCKSDPFVPGPAHEIGSTGNYYANFQADDQVSYSFAYPYLVTPAGGVVGDWWKNTSDSSQPVASDMAPLNGTGSPRRDVSLVRPGATKSANSGNHLGDGQNIAFADAHAEFMRRPDIGPGDDNIFTVGGGGPSAGGTQPSRSPILLNQRPPFDTVLVPARNLDNGRLW